MFEAHLVSTVNCLNIAMEHFAAQHNPQQPQTCEERLHPLTAAIRGIYAGSDDSGVIEEVRQLE